MGYALGNGIPLEFLLEVLSVKSAESQGGPDPKKALLVLVQGIGKFIAHALRKTIFGKLVGLG
jgi:hypothetical protein